MTAHLLYLVSVVVSAAAGNDAEWAVVAGCARVSPGAGLGVVGTAVCVGNRDGYAYLLAAAHVVPKGEARAYEFFTRESYPKPARTLAQGEVVLRLADADVALIRVPTGPNPVPVVRLAGPGGRPRRFPFAAASVGCPGGVPPAWRAESIADKKLVRRPAGGVAFFWQASDAAIGGMSGGPLVSADGRVIGICSATQGGAGYFTHLDEILFGLKEAGYTWLFES